MGILGNSRRRIAGVIDQNLLCRDGDVHCMPEAFHIKRSVRPEELQQVERSQVACRIVEEHVLGARIRSINASRGLARVPAIDRGVVLHPGIAAVPG